MSLTSKATRFAATLPPESPLRKELTRLLLREAARGRRDEDPTPMTDLAGYMEGFERMMLLPYPAIYDALGLERRDVKVTSSVNGQHGHLRITTESGTDLDITVDGKDGSHRVEGQVQGHTLQPKTFKFRPPMSGWHRGTQGDITSYVEDNFVGTYTYRVCTTGGCEDYPDVFALTKRYKQVGTQERGSVRKDLVGQPLLAGLIGPMWDGRKGTVGVIRYEDQATYDRNSD